MLVSCSECNRSYNDAHRWTLCPHPHLNDWEAKSHIQAWKESHSQANLDAERLETNRQMTETVGLHSSPKSQIILSREKLVKLCVVLGLKETLHTNRIILDIGVGGVVTIYTRALMRDQQFDDVFNLLIEDNH